MGSRDGRSPGPWACILCLLWVRDVSPPTFKGRHRPTTQQGSPTLPDPDLRQHPNR